MFKNMEENILNAHEVQMYVSAMKPTSIQDIGDKSWLECHVRLQKLQQQAFIEAKTFRDESVKEALASFQKIQVLIHDCICVSVWRRKILPKILQIQSNPSSTFLLYAVVFHEATTISLLEIVIYHPECIECLDQASIDLLDYLYDNLLVFLDATCQNVSDNDDWKRQQLEITREIGVRSISILFHLIVNIDRLTLSTISRIFKTKDIPLLLTHLLQTKPWIRVKENEKQILVNNRWLPIGDQVPQIEAQTWLSLRQLLLSSHCRDMYEITTFKQNRFVQLLTILNENLLDQVSALVDLRHWLGQLSVMTVESSASTKANLIFEVVPQMETNIWKSVRNSSSLAEKHARRFFTNDTNTLRECAAILSEAYEHGALLHENMTENQVNDETNTNENLCMCGAIATKKCSKCRAVWYCERKCQVADWLRHKEKCSTTN